MHFQNKIIQEIILKNIYIYFFLTLLWFWYKRYHINSAKYQHISQSSCQSVMCAAATHRHGLTVSAAPLMQSAPVTVHASLGLFTPQARDWLRFAQGV